MSVTNKCYFTIDLSPTFEAIYGRTSSLIHLGQLKEVPKYIKEVRIMDRRKFMMKRLLFAMNGL